MAVHSHFPEVGERDEPGAKTSPSAAEGDRTWRQSGREEVAAGVHAPERKVGAPTTAFCPLRSAGSMPNLWRLFKTSRRQGTGRRASRSVRDDVATVATMTSPGR